MTVSHLGGTSTVPTPLIVVTEPSAITAIVPATIPIGTPTQITVQGTNLARARGICLPGTSGLDPHVARTDPVTSNDRLVVTVTATAPVSGPIRVAVPPNVQQRQYTICQTNQSPVTLTAQ